METIVIKDPNTKKFREVKNLKIVRHEIPDEDGEMKGMKVVEFIVIGNNGEWKNFAEYEKFKLFNKDIDI